MSISFDNLKVGFTGTREGMTETQSRGVHELLYNWGVSEFHHGDCLGADAEAHKIARELGIPVVVHPPCKTSMQANCGDYLDIRKPLHYLERDRKIVEETEILIATPKNFAAQGSGTWYTINYARKMKRPVFIVC